jgi:hypothetical protein
MPRLSSVAGRRPVLLLATLALLALALLLPAARPASAFTCGIGCYPGAGTIYYTDATRRHILCEVDCNVDTCNGDTSPWYRFYHTCCCT